MITRSRKLKYSKENLEKIIKESKNVTEVLQKLNLRAAGGNYQVIKNYIKMYDLDVKHFEIFKQERINLLVNKVKLKQIPLNDILCKNSNYNRTHLKARLYKEGLKKRGCELCGQGEIWKGNKMSLILDHKNGVNNDNRIENLRIVCPNCNATLPTHCSKNINNK